MSQLPEFLRNAIKDCPTVYLTQPLIPYPKLGPSVAPPLERCCQTSDLVHQSAFLKARQ
jgi:hypothetical protein